MIPSTPAYKGYVLSILTLIYTWNYVDRNLIALLLQPIETDLHLSDTQGGLVTGIVFGLFYATLGIPIARWADRGNRVTITSIAIGLWGITVMSCLLVRNFTQLACARIAAAVGEAGCMPPTYSLLGDYFPDSMQRLRAMTVYMLANPLSSLVSLALGGVLNERYGWRWTFFIAGIPGLLMALLTRLTLREPRALGPRPLLPQQSQSPQRLPLRELGQQPQQPHVPLQSSPRPPGSQRTIIEVLVTLWRQAALCHLCLAYILILTLAVGLSPWYGAFLIRSHGMSVHAVGLSLGLIFGLAGTAGVLSGGYVATRWFASDERGQARLCALTAAVLVPSFALFLLLPKLWQSLSILVPFVVVFNAFVGPTFALIQRLVPAEIRAQSLAVIMLLANLIGLGAGPLIVGALSDFLKPSCGNDSLRYAMLTMSFLALGSAYHFWKSGATVTADIAALDVES